MKHKYYTNERNVQIVIGLLKAHGIRKVVASPGTTNITFVGSIQQDPWFEIYSSVDERSAAYIACGLAAESGEPVVLSCTGATASRNYYSGMTEAYYRKLPIIAITSHQGNFRIGHLIAQNIDRRQLAKDMALLSVEAPLVKDENDEKFCTIEVNKALLELSHRGGGPVHINLFTNYSKDFSVKELPPVRAIFRHTPFDAMPEIPTGNIAVFVGSHKKFTNEETKALDTFCATYDAVVFCDHTSGYRGTYEQHFALPLSQNNYTSPHRHFNLLIHIGEVSGDYSSLSINANKVWRINEDGELRDTFGRLTDVFEMSEIYFFKHYAKEGINNRNALSACEKENKELHSELPDFPFGNIWIAQQLAPRLPEGSRLHLGILNTLRSWNYFDIPPKVESFSNVGGFGIDGCVSTLIGASLVNKEKLYFGVFGDLALFYDMNVLGNRHVGNNVRILLINNGKGTEFRNYNHPCNAFGSDADAYMAAAGHYGNMSRNLIRHYATDLGYEYLSSSNKKEFLVVMERFVTPQVTDRPMLLEAFTDSQDESDALEMINNSKAEITNTLLNKAKSIAKTVLGDNGMQIVKKALK